MIKILSRFSIIGILGFLLTLSPNTFASDMQQRSYTTSFVLGALVFSNFIASTLALGSGCYSYSMSCPDCNATSDLSCLNSCVQTCSSLYPTDCFPRQAQVEVLSSDDKTSSFKPMSELLENEWVLTGYEQDDQSGRINKLFEPVKEFLHREPNEELDILQIYFNETQYPLEISKDHMVKILKLQQDASPTVDLLNKFAVEDSDILWQAAHEVQVNDFMLVNGKINFVTEIKEAKAKGKFTPLTNSGRLIVNGAQVSAFAGEGQTISQSYINWTRSRGIGNRGKIISSEDLNKDVAINEVDSEARKLRVNIHNIYQQFVVGT